MFFLQQCLYLFLILIEAVVIAAGCLSQVFTCSRVDCISEGFPLLFDVVLTIPGCDRQPSFKVTGVIFSNLAALQPGDIKPLCSILPLGSSYWRDAKFALHQDESMVSPTVAPHMALAVLTSCLSVFQVMT